MNDFLRLQTIDCIGKSLLRLQIPKFNIVQQLILVLFFVFYVLIRLIQDEQGTFPLLTVIYGVLTLLGGINKVQWAIDMLRAKQKYWFVAIISAVLTLVFSALILANPFASTAVLWTFIAVTLIVEAVIDIAAFILGRKSFDQAD